MQDELEAQKAEALKAWAVAFTHTVGREAGVRMKADPADLVVLLDMLGDGQAHGNHLVLPDYAANKLAEILNSLPGYANRPKRGPSAAEYRALMDECDGKPLNAMAREIAGQTGQLYISVRRRLQDIRKRRLAKLERMAQRQVRSK